jgi:hypothetical protein
METTRSFVHSARKWQQRPKNVSGTNCTNKHTKPTEFCAFCACKQQQRTHTRTLALSTCDPLQQHTHACNNDTKTPQTDGTTFLALSTSKQQRWPNHGSETGDKTNATTLLFDIPIPNKRQQPMNESNDGIRTKNYYACLDNGETDEDDNEYSNATTNDEFLRALTKTNDNTNHNPTNHTPSQPSSLHDISTLMSSLPTPVPPCFKMAQNNTNGNNATPTAQNNTNGKNATHSNNGTNGMTGPPGNPTNTHNNGTTKSNTGSMNSTKQNGTQDSHTSMKWQPQARLITQWTRQHLDSFLALAEVACEWNIEPG